MIVAEELPDTLPDGVAGITGITASADAPAITVTGSKISINGLVNGDHVAVHTIDGRAVAFLNATAPAFSIDVARGIYIVTAGDST